MHLFKLCYDVSDFTKPHYYQKHYRMESTANWNGRKQDCWGYCFRDTTNASHCMCNPSLMQDKEYSILAGDYIYLILEPHINRSIHLIKVICINDIPNHFSGSFAAVFGVMGFILNILVVLALRQVARTDLSTLFVISLSFSDLFMCGFYLPLQSARFLFRYYILKRQSLLIF